MVTYYVQYSKPFCPSQVSYVTTVLPYFVLSALLITALTREGSWQGILYLLTPRWEKLASLTVSIFMKQSSNIAYLSLVLTILYLIKKIFYYLSYTTINIAYIYTILLIFYFYLLSLRDFHEYQLYASKSM